MKIVGYPAIYSTQKNLERNVFFFADLTLPHNPDF